MLINFYNMSAGRILVTRNFGEWYGMWKRKTGRKNLIRKKERNLGPGTSTALKTDCTSFPYNP